MKKTRKIKDLRPTPSLVKNALFNILGDIENLIFVDLFAGTGQIGISAEHLGARVIFVEVNQKRASAIRKKVRGRVVCGDALKFLNRFEGEFHIIFADPPYEYGNYERLIRKAIKALTPGGIFVLEHYKKLRFDAEETRIYGDTALSFWRKRE